MHILDPNHSIENRITKIEESLTRLEKAFEEMGLDLSKGINNNTTQIDSIIQALSMIDISVKES